jgi:hypothetical protein
MKNIVIVSLFGDIYNTNSRAHKIANAFSERVSFVTPDFSHGEKKYKSKTTFIEKNPFIIKYIHVPDYNKNLSVKRIYSHLVFSKKLRRYLNNLSEKPDIVYCMMPPSSSAYICGKYCKKNDIPFVVDVIDLWPDSLIPIIQYSKLFKLVLLPWKELTRKAYKMATYISGESQAYASAAHKFNPSVPWSYTYLGVDLDQTQKLIARSKLHFDKPDHEIWICYGGSLGNSYDFDSILNAIKFIHEKNIKYRMFFVGEGEKRNLIENFTNKNSLNSEITGRVDYKDFLKYLSVCDIGLNVFKKGTRVVHSYKFNDYVGSHLFILNNLVGETSEMVNKYKIGLNYNDLSDALFNVCQNWDTYSKYRLNLDDLIKDELDTNVIYKKLINNILKLIN